MTKIVFVPGNGGSSTQNNWFPGVKKSLKAEGLSVVDALFPDPEWARQAYWIPISEPRYIHKQLNCEYHEYKDQGHFGDDYLKPDFPELTQAILRNLKRFAQNTPKVNHG